MAEACIAWPCSCDAVPCPGHGYLSSHGLHDLLGAAAGLQHVELFDLRKERVEGTHDAHGGCFIETNDHSHCSTTRCSTTHTVDARTHGMIADAIRPHWEQQGHTHALSSRLMIFSPMMYLFSLSQHFIGPLSSLVPPPFFGLAVPVWDPRPPPPLQPCPSRTPARPRPPQSRSRD